MRRPDWTGVLQERERHKASHTPHFKNQKWYGSSFPKFNALSLDIRILFHIPHPSHSQPILGLECNIIHRSDHLDPRLCCPSWVISYKTVMSRFINTLPNENFPILVCLFTACDLSDTPFITCPAYIWGTNIHGDTVYENGDITWQWTRTTHACTIVYEYHGPRKYHTM